MNRKMKWNECDEQQRPSEIRQGDFVAVACIMIWQYDSDGNNSLRNVQVTHFGN